MKITELPMRCDCGWEGTVATAQLADESDAGGTLVCPLCGAIARVIGRWVVKSDAKGESVCLVRSE